MVKRSTKKKSLDQAITQLVWILEPDSKIELIIKLLVAYHNEGKNVWRIYRVEDDSAKYHYYLFILSVLAKHFLLENRQGAVLSSEKIAEPFPIFIDHPIYGQIVRYLHNVKSQG